MLKRFQKDERGAVAVMVALLLPILLGFVALVAEFGNGFAVKAENQRVADLAAYAGATAFLATRSNDDMNQAVARIATLNGIDPSAATASLIQSPRTAGSQAVSVLVSTGQSLLLAPVIGDQTALQIRADAAAQIPALEIPGCIIALDASQTGVTLSGGTRINAPGCSVSSNSSVTVPCGTTMTTRAVNYNSAAAPTQPCNGIQAPSGQSLTITRTSTADPLAANADVASATARLTTAAGLSAPTITAAAAVTVPTSSLNFDFPYWNDTNWINNTFKNSASNYRRCTAVYNNGWTIDCPYGYDYTVNNFRVGGGLAVTINLTGTPAPTSFNFYGTYSTQGTTTWPQTDAAATNVTFNFNNTATLEGTSKLKGNINANQGMTISGTATLTGNSSGAFKTPKALTMNGGATATFTYSTYDIFLGITTNGGSNTTFNAGTFNIGIGTNSCSGANYSICHTGTTLTFDGPSTFNLAAGIYNNGGSVMSFGGTATTNEYNIGPSSAGNAIQVGGGSKTTFADTDETFEVAGNINVVSGGGSCLTLPSATNHDIKGYISSAGGTTFGAGVYTVRDYIAFGAGGGGNVTCNGNNIGVQAENVTMVIGGTNLPASGTCSGQAFCVGAGYSNVNITAPAATSLAVVGPTTSGTAGATLTGGASNNRVSGAFYFPRGPILMSGGAGIGDGQGQCLQMIGSRVTLSGGTAAASACISNATAGNGAVMLVD